MNNQDARFLDLLRKWQSGDFTRSDEREMDALTQGDDFRRETWEGFAAHPGAGHEQNLAALRLRLRQRAGLGQTRRIGGSPVMMAAAAALALFIVAAFFFRENQQQPGEPLADSAAAPVAPEQAPGVASTENYSADNQSFAANEAPRTLTQSPAARLDRASSAPGSAAGSGPTPGDYAAAPPPAAADATTGKPTADAVSEQRAEADLTQDDRIANVPLESMTQAQSKAAPPSGGATDKQTDAKVAEFAKKKSTVSPAAKPTPTAPVVLKPDTTWNKTGTPPDMTKRRKEAREAERPVQSEPSTGWEAFQDYLRQTARLTPAARTKNVSGTVRLQFTVSENGEPQGFVTLRSVGYGCDQEAVRLVKDWVWVRGQNPTVTVEIPFVR